MIQSKTRQQEQSGNMLFFQSEVCKGNYCNCFFSQFFFILYALPSIYQASMYIFKVINDLQKKLTEKENIMKVFAFRLDLNKYY